MKYYWLAPKDQRHNNFILFHDSTDTRPVTLRDRYADLRCSNCNKFDELAAIERGIDPDVSIRAKQDFVACDYGLIAISDRFRSVLADNRILGVSNVALAASEKYAILLPDVVAETNVDNCGVEFHRPCSCCGRYRETCLFPMIDNMTLPESDLIIFASTAPAENVHTADHWFLTSKTVVDILRANKITGVEYSEAY